MTGTAISGALLDIDGTLLTGDDAIPGAAGAVAWLRDGGARFRLTTNTTRRPRSEVAAVLRAAGISVSDDEVLAPSILARSHMLDSGRVRAALLVAEASVEDFAGIERVEDRPDWVVVGDLGAGFTWDVVNRAFRWLMDGAGLIALQRNRYWNVPPHGLTIDAGPYVAALEEAAGVEAVLVGKPSSVFFDLALGEIGLPARQVVAVGDDVRTDIAGGHTAGCRTALVRTGKFRPEDEASAPDLVLDSIAGLKGSSLRWTLAG